MNNFNAVIAVALLGVAPNSVFAENPLASHSRCSVEQGQSYIDQARYEQAVREFTCLIESDPALSKPITDDPSAPNPGAGDWFVLIDATDVDAVPAAMLRFSGNIALKPLIISSGIYRLMWDLAKGDIG